MISERDHYSLQCELVQSYLLLDETSSCDKA